VRDQNRIEEALIGDRLNSLTVDRQTAWAVKKLNNVPPFGEFPTEIGTNEAL